MSKILLIIFLLKSITSYEKQGIDLNSKHEEVNWSLISKKDFDFAIINIGSRLIIPKGEKLVIDKYFTRNYKGGKERGLKIGGTWYNYAKNIKQAEKEAKSCLNIVKKYKFEYPIFYIFPNMELLNTGKNNVISVAKTFCDYLIKNKILCGFFAFPNIIEYYFDEDLKNNYPIWIQDHKEGESNYKGKWGIRQYTHFGYINNWGYNVHKDISIVDYFKIIKEGHFNGY